MRTTISALIFALVGLTSHLAVADDGFATSGDATVGQRQPTAFRVQPTIESVREGLALKGPPSPAEMGLKNAIQRSAIELREKMIICRGC
jgi:hypothetical protein